LRESFSKPFRENNEGKAMVRQVATLVERVSNTTGVGMLIPFGQFFNNSIAFLGDYSGLNFLGHVYRKALGKTIDYTEESGINLAAKTAVGWAAVIGHFVPNAMEKI